MMNNTKKNLILSLFLCLQACASDERTKILESNVKNMEVYASDGQLICKEMPCEIKFNKKEGKSQIVKLKLDGFEAEEEVSVKIWNFERYLRRTGSISNIVLYPISIADAPITGVTEGPTISAINSGFHSGCDDSTVGSIEGSTKGTTIAALTQMRMVNDIWFYDLDHIYIDVKLCGKKGQCISPHQLGYEGYGYEITYREKVDVGDGKRNISDLVKTDTIKQESIQKIDLIKKDEIIIKRFVLHNYPELKAYRWEYMRTLGDLTGLETRKLEKIIDKSNSAPELAETLARYSNKKNQKGAH